MGLFDSIRRAVGGGDADDDADDDAATQPDVIDTHDLDEAELRERAAGVAGEVDVLDFSLTSLAQFDDAIDAGYDEDLATSDTPGAYATDTVRFGCYLGEVLVRAYEGEWTRNPDWGVTISGPDGTTTVAVFDVAERSITTGAVFAAVADRAAVEVGLDGAPADGATDEATDGTSDTVSEPPTDDGDDTGMAVDDEQPASPGDDEPAAPAPGDDEPAAPAPSDDEPPAVPSDSHAADETADRPDPLAADTGLTEADREAVDRVVEDADTESLIDEAEPEQATGDAATGESPPSDEPATDPATATGDAPVTPDQNADDSLFEDAAAGAGPTVADAPSADDGAPAPASELGSPGNAADGTDRDGATDDGTDRDGDPSEAPDTAAAGDDLRATYAEAAEELVSFWTEYELDYSPDSLERLDALVSEEWDDDRFDDADFGSDDSFDDRVFTSVSTELGGYFGEVLVRELDAEWSGETATDAVVVEGADGPLAIPVFKVAGTSIRQQPVFARSYDSLLSDLEG